MLKITPRMLAIMNMVEKGSRLADVGTDHGIIPVVLVLNGKVNKVVASDISYKSLEKAVRIIKKYGLDMYIDARVGYGLEVLAPYEVDNVIIAGLSGKQIAEILEKSPHIAKEIKRFILQPVQHSDYLRKWLVTNSYKIIDEDLVIENDKFYQIIVARKGKQLISDDIFYEIGPKLFEKKHPLLKKFINGKILKTKKIIENLENSNHPENIKKIEFLLQKLKKYEVIYDAL